MARNRKESRPEEPQVKEKEDASINSAEILGEKKAGLYAENATILEDPIFKKITTSIDGGWEKLDENAKEEVLTAFGELLFAIKNYDDSYRKLKGIVSYKLSDTANATSRERHKNDISDADRREHELHNRFLDTVNILSRRMHELGLDNSWRGDEMIFPHPTNAEANRQKVKLWMFRVFSE